MVLMGRHGPVGHTYLARFLQEFEVETVSFTPQHSTIAMDVFSRFGKGRHKAGLNYGGCLTYATAYLAQEPLLFVGNEFTHTDLRLVA